MEIKIYQIDSEKDDNRLRYMSHDYTEKHGGINPEIYNNVFDGAVHANDLEEVFLIFNTVERPATFQGRSISVSDIVEVKEDTPASEKGFYFCDSFGFKKVDFNFSESIMEDVDLHDSPSLSL